MSQPESHSPARSGSLPPRRWVESRTWGLALMTLYGLVVAWSIGLKLIVKGGLPGRLLVEISRMSALIAFTLLVLQVVLAGRFKRLDAPFGLDRLMRFHKRMALLAGILLLTHPILISLGRGNFSLLTTDTRWFILLGKTALVIVAGMIAFSWLFGRIGVDYNTWRFIHKGMILIIVLGFIHSMRVGDDLTKTPMIILWSALLSLAAGIFVYRNGYVPVWGRRRFRVSDIRQETHDTYTLRFEPTDGWPMPRHPGQFMFLRLVRPGRRSETHPFTISASALEPAIVEATIKESGDFTATIGQTRPGDHGLIEGPFGRFSFMHFDVERFVFIAGGVGITPIISMLRYLRDTRDSRPATLIYGNKTEADILFTAELADLPAPIRVVHVLSRPAPGWPGPTGHITAAMIQKCVGEGLPGSDFFLCGPDAMMKAVLSELDKVHIDRHRIHYERFAI